MFSKPQIVLFSRDVERFEAFYHQLGFTETFRVPTEGPPIHIDGYLIGIASVESTRDDHQLQPVESGQHAAVVLWTEDTEAAYKELATVVAGPSTPLLPPRPVCEVVREPPFPALHSAGRYEIRDALQSADTRCGPNHGIMELTE